MSLLYTSAYDNCWGFRNKIEFLISEYSQPTVQVMADSMGYRSGVSLCLEFWGFDKFLGDDNYKDDS